MTRPIHESDGAGNLIQYLHEEALHQQHALDTWQFATALAGRHHAEAKRTRITLKGGKGWPDLGARRFLDGAGEPDDLGVQTEFTRD